MVSQAEVVALMHRSPSQRLFWENRPKIQRRSSFDSQAHTLAWGRCLRSGSSQSVLEICGKVQQGCPWGHVRADFSSARHCTKARSNCFASSSIGCATRILDVSTLLMWESQLPESQAHIHRPQAFEKHTGCSSAASVLAIHHRPHKSNGVLFQQQPVWWDQQGSVHTEAAASFRASSCPKVSRDKSCSTGWWPKRIANPKPNKNYNPKVLLIDQTNIVIVVQQYCWSNKHCNCNPTVFLINQAL